MPQTAPLASHAKEETSDQAVDFEKCAFVTVIYNDAYVCGAIVLSASLRAFAEHSGIAMVIMIGPEVSEESEQLLRKGAIVRRVEHIRQDCEVRWGIQKDLYEHWLPLCFTKIRALELTQYDKVLFLDADTVCTAPLADVFNFSAPAGILTDQHFPRMLDIEPGHHPTHAELTRSMRTSYGMAGCCMLLHPSEEDAAALQATVAQSTSYGDLALNAGPDEQLFTQYYADKWICMPPEFCTVAWKAPVIKNAGRTPRILHFVTEKPWNFTKYWADYGIWLRVARNLLKTDPSYASVLPVDRINKTHVVPTRSQPYNSRAEKLDMKSRRRRRQDPPGKYPPSEDPQDTVQVHHPRPVHR